MDTAYGGYAWIQEACGPWEKVTRRRGGDHRARVGLRTCTRHPDRLGKAGEGQRKAYRRPGIWSSGRRRPIPGEAGNRPPCSAVDTNPRGHSSSAGEPVSGCKGRAGCVGSSCALGNLVGRTQAHRRLDCPVAGRSRLGQPRRRQGARTGGNN